MTRTITVKGTGNVSVKPDEIELRLKVEGADAVYDRAMAKAAQVLEKLRNALMEIGFEKDALKTTDFGISTRNKSVTEPGTRTTRYVFWRYECVNRLKLTFDMDMELLSKTLNAIAVCAADPDLSIRFTIKDPAAASEALLKAAAANARAKAEVLCAASGVTLGELVTINYNWGELDIYSDTGINMRDDGIMREAACAPDITPDDIDLSDTVTFVWEIR